MDERFPNMPNYVPPAERQARPASAPTANVEPPVDPPKEPANLNPASDASLKFRAEDAFQASLVQGGVHVSSQPTTNSVFQTQDPSGLAEENKPAEFAETPLSPEPEQEEVAEAEITQKDAFVAQPTAAPAEPKKAKKTKAESKKDKKERRDRIEKNTQAVLSLIFGLLALAYCILSFFFYGLILSSIAIALALAGFLTGFLSRKIEKNMLGTIGMILSGITLLIALALFVISMLAQAGTLAVDPIFLQ